MEYVKLSISKQAYEELQRARNSGQLSPQITTSWSAIIIAMINELLPKSKPAEEQQNAA